MLPLFITLLPPMAYIMEFSYLYADFESLSSVNLAVVSTCCFQYCTLQSDYRFISVPPAQSNHLPCKWDLNKCKIQPSSVYLLLLNERKIPCIELEMLFPLLHSTNIYLFIELSQKDHSEVAKGYSISYRLNFFEVQYFRSCIIIYFLLESKTGILFSFE